MSPTIYFSFGNFGVLFRTTGDEPGSVTKVVSRFTLLFLWGCGWVYVCIYMCVCANTSTLEFKGQIAVKFCIRGIVIFSHYEGKWILCKAKIICVTEISLEWDKILVLWPFLFVSLIPQASLVLNSTALKLIPLCFMGNIFSAV